jgi:hypothetical protein
MLNFSSKISILTKSRSFYFKLTRLSHTSKTNDHLENEIATEDSIEKFSENEIYKGFKSLAIKERRKILDDFIGNLQKTNSYSLQYLDKNYESQVLESKTFNAFKKKLS